MESTERTDPRETVDDRLMLASVRRSLFGPDISVPVKAGRFVVLDRVGSGGMGTVFRAYDPELDRRVALKVLKPDANEGVTARSRLQREAVALARLNHPNVVTVHEVGDVGGELFVAMEYVEGVDLGRWITEHPVGTRARFQAALRILLQAGRGLEAAHRADLVHRDFKPSNLLVGDDRRVRVADFGLVHAGGDTSGQSEQPRSSGRRGGLTQTGNALGTPRYMSPEQRRGENVDARSDQFSYCVAAWEVLLGARPWDGPFPSPHYDPPHSPESAPGWVVEVLARGLQAQPERRYPSMTVLLAALSKDPHRRRRRLAGVGGTLAAVAVAAAGHLYYRASLCDDGSKQLDRTYNEPMRAALSDLFVETLGNAEAWERVDGHLTAFTQRWLATFEQVCDAGRRRGAMDETELAAAMGCLELELAELAAAVELLGASDAKTVDFAAEVAAYPGGKRRCDRPRTAHTLPVDPEQARRLLETYRELEVVRILRSTWRYDEAGQRLAGLEPTLATVEHPAVQLPATRVRVVVLREQGRPTDAVDLARPAYYAAIERGDDYAAMSLAVQLAELAQERNDVDLASNWQGLAQMHAQRAAVGPQDRAFVAMSAAKVALRRGDTESAAEHAIEGVGLMQSAHGPDHPYTLQVANTLATVRAQTGDLEEAAALFDRVYAGFAAVFGPRSPRLVPAMHNAYVARFELGQHDEALARARECVELAKARWPEGHLGLATELFGYGAVLFATGRSREAVAVMREVTALLDRLGLADSEDGLTNRRNLAGSLEHLGQFEDAVQVAEQAAAAHARALGAEHPTTAVTLGLLGRSQLSLGQFARAEQALVRAEAILAKVSGTEAPATQVVRVHLASLARERDDPRTARAQLAPIVDGPASDSVLRLALRERARVLEALGRADEALHDATRVIELPRDQRGVARMRALRSRMLMSVGRQPEALAEAELGLDELESREDPRGRAELEAARRAAIPE